MTRGQRIYTQHEVEAAVLVLLVFAAVAFLIGLLIGWAL